MNRISMIAMPAVLLSSIAAPWLAPCMSAVPAPPSHTPPIRDRQESLPPQLAEVIDEGIDTVGVNEPSGIAFDAGRSAIYVVGDGGDIAELSAVADDRLSRQRIRGDFEGLALRAGGDTLYLIEERVLDIIDMRIAEFEVSARRSIDPMFEGERIFDGSNDGAEGMAIVPGAEADDGVVDRWFICRQGADNPAHWPALVVELKEAAQEGSSHSFEIVRTIAFEGAKDFADLYYDDKNSRLVILSDAQDALYLYDLSSGEARRASGLPGENQEGFTVDAEGAWLIAQDSGGVIKARPHMDLGQQWEVAAKVATIEKVRSNSQQ